MVNCVFVATTDGKKYNNECLKKTQRSRFETDDHQDHKPKERHEDKYQLTQKTRIDDTKDQRYTVEKAR